MGYVQGDQLQLVNYPNEEILVHDGRRFDWRGSEHSWTAIQSKLRHEGKVLSGATAIFLKDRRTLDQAYDETYGPKGEALAFPADCSSAKALLLLAKNKDRESQ